MSFGLNELIKAVRQPELIMRCFDDSSYDELIEIDIKALEFKSDYHVSKKYAMPIMRGSYKDMFIAMSEDLIHPDERESFVELMNPDTILNTLNNSDIKGIYFGEYRFRLVTNGWRWVELVLISGEQYGIVPNTVRMYIFDCHSRKCRELGISDNSVYLAHDYNEMTGLLRKRAFIKSIDPCLKSSDAKWCLVSIDIENFKLFNEWYGHSEGDLLMVQIGAAINETCAETGGTAGYFGQDDFCMLIPYDMERIKGLYEDITSLVGARGSSVGFLPAFGVSVVQDDCAIMDLLDRAFLAGQVAKEGYHSRIRVFDKSMYMRTDEEYHVLTDFLQAFKRREVTFYLQPQCRASSGKIVGAEALARWIKPDGAVVPPDMFIPILEKRGLISDLDLYIWEEVCCWLRKWIDGGHTPLPVSVNVSVADILHTDLADIFEKLVEKYELERRLIKIEITESSYISNTALVRNTVRSLREKGYTVLMDDFGSGFSTLNMLKSLSVDIIKLDAQFLNIDESNEEKSIRILESVTNMTKTIGIPIIVEGVETEEQKEFLQDLGCSYIQGYYFYRPMPISDYEKLIADPKLIDTSGVSFKSNQQFRLRELLDSNIYSDTMLNNILGPCALYAWHGDEVDIERYNEQFYEAVNVPDFSDRMLNINRFMPLSDQPRIIGLLREAVRDRLNGSKGILRFYKTDGSLTTFYLRFYYLNTEGESKVFYGSARNITKLSTLERQMYLLAHSSSDTVLFLTRMPDDKVRFNVLINGLEPHIGMTARELEYDLNTENFPERVKRENSPEVYNGIIEKINRSESFTGRIHIRGVDGELLTINVNGTYLPDETDTMDYIIILNKIDN